MRLGMTGRDVRRTHPRAVRVLSVLLTGFFVAAAIGFSGIGCGSRASTPDAGPFGGTGGVAGAAGSAGRGGASGGNGGGSVVGSGGATGAGGSTGPGGVSGSGG